MFPDKSANAMARCAKRMKQRRQRQESAKKATKFEQRRLVGDKNNFPSITQGINSETDVAHVEQ